MSSSWKIQDIIRDNVDSGKRLTNLEAHLHRRNPSVVEAVMASKDSSASAPAANSSKKRKATTVAASAPAKKRKAASAKAFPVKKQTTAMTTVASGSSSRKRKGEPSAAGSSVPAKKARTAAKKASAAPAENTPGSESGEEDDKPPVKPVAKGRGRVAAKVAANKAPTSRLNVYVFGEGANGELGLGERHNFAEGVRVTDVRRPRLNANLLAESVGVVQLATGGMHVAALTHDGVVLTWGVNDQGALGRETKQADQMRDADGGDESDDDEDTGMNPLEAVPGPVSRENVPEGTVFTRVAAGDSVTMAVTATGLVYGCGTFRSNEGILGFSADSTIQTTLVQVKGLKNIVDVVCGDNHVVALDNKGNCFAFGSGQQNQLGRRVVERTRMNGLVPRDFGLPKGKITQISAGAYHSFAIDDSNRVWTWGLNNFGETGIAEGAGEDGAMVLKPAIVKALEGKKIVSVAGGAHHSLAATESGEILAWGRTDGSQTGIDIEEIPEENFVKDAKGEPNKRLLMVPTVVPNISGAVLVAAGTDSSMAVTEDGKAYSWGFSENYQTGQGQTDDVEEATLFDNKAVRDQKLVWAGAGGQYGVLASEVVDVEMNDAEGGENDEGEVGKGKGKEVVRG